jgi:hypothetical protein
MSTSPVDNVGVFFRKSVAEISHPRKRYKFSNRTFFNKINALSSQILARARARGFGFCSSLYIEDLLGMVRGAGERKGFPDLWTTSTRRARDGRTRETPGSGEALSGRGGPGRGCPTVERREGEEKPPPGTLLEAIWALEGPGAVGWGGPGSPGAIEPGKTSPRGPIRGRERAFFKRGAGTWKGAR